MEYAFTIIGSVVILIGCYILLQVKVIRDRARALFLEAEKNITADKLNYVTFNLYSKFPKYVTFFLPYASFKVIVQKIYDETRKVARDVLNDGKINGK